MKKYNNLQTKRRFISGKMIVGIDPANDKHQAAVIDANGIIQGNPFTFAHSYNGFHNKLWAKLKKQIFPLKPDQVVFAIESSCNLWQNLTYYLCSQGYTVVLVSPLTTHKSRPLMDHSFSKTDPKDAIVIANSARDGYFDFHVQHNSTINAMHQLAIAYDKVRRNYVQTRCRLRAQVKLIFPEFLKVLGIDTLTADYLLKKYLTPQDFLNLSIMEDLPKLRKIYRQQFGLDTLNKLKAAANHTIGIPLDSIQYNAERDIMDGWLLQLNMFRKKMKCLADQLIAFAKQTPYFDSLCSLKGISEVSAALLIAELRDLNLFEHFKQIEKFAGYNLRLSQSGNYTGYRRMSHIGNKRLSSLLYRMTAEAVKYIPEVRIKFINRQLNRALYRKNIVACVPVLLKLMMALAKEQRLYEERPAKLKQLEPLEQAYQQHKQQRQQNQLKQVA
jgi:transposase